MTAQGATLSESRQRGRLLSLDVLRGLTVAGMILVTDPGTYAHVYHQLTHAPWNDPTTTDLIFPCFLVMVGLSIGLSFSQRLARGASGASLSLRVVRRSVLLLGLGLVVNGFPDYHLATMRLPGILQRIAVCYLVAALLFLALAGRVRSKNKRQRTIAAVCGALLLLYWTLLRFYPTPGFGAGRLDPLGNVAAVLDRAAFTVPHMFKWGIKTPGVGITFDPEGILSTLGALGTMLLGVIAGQELTFGGSQRRQCARIAIFGTVLWIVGLLLRPAMPLNKQIYTPTFALWSAGLSLVAFAATFFLVDIRGVRRGWTLLLIFGTNAILAFVLSQVITSLFGLIRVGGAGHLPLYMWLDAFLFGSWLPPRPASLAWAISIVLLNALLLYPLFRKRILLRL